MSVENKIQNIHLLIDVFGRFPSFHDAEVLQMVLNRGEGKLFNPSLQVSIYVFEMTSQVGENNKFILKNHKVVTFHFEEIFQLSLENFNHQNVLQELNIIDMSENQSESGNFEVSFEGIFGVTTKFRCNAITVESVEPFASKAT